MYINLIKEKNNNSKDFYSLAFDPLTSYNLTLC